MTNSPKSGGDSQKPDRDMYGWTRFKGTRNEWAWYWLDFHYAFHAKEQDDVETEVFCQELKKTKEDYDALKQQVQNMREALAEMSESVVNNDIPDFGQRQKAYADWLKESATQALEQFDKIL